MRVSALSLFLLSSAFGVLAAEEELKIDVTHEVACESKTKAGDQVQVHYKGTLQSDGSKFDSSS